MRVIRPPLTPPTQEGKRSEMGCDLSVQPITSFST